MILKSANNDFKDFAAMGKRGLCNVVAEQRKPRKKTKRPARHPAKKKQKQKSLVDPNWDPKACLPAGLEMFGADGHGMPEGNIFDVGPFSNHALTFPRCFTFQVRMWFQTLRSMGCRGHRLSVSPRLTFLDHSRNHSATFRSRNSAQSG